MGQLVTPRSGHPIVFRGTAAAVPVSAPADAAAADQGFRQYVGAKTQHVYIRNLDATDTLRIYFVCPLSPAFASQFITIPPASATLPGAALLLPVRTDGVWLMGSTGACDFEMMIMESDG